MTTHNKTQTREYHAWIRMKKSCLNKNYPAYQFYGAKGATICDEWVNDFTKFFSEMGEMPSDCNGLQLIDFTLPFCKLNCKWIFKTGGRKPLEKKIEKVNRRASGIKNPKNICLVLDGDHLEYIRRQAIAKSQQEGVLIEPNQLIREALQKAFPVPKQFDMFGGKIQNPLNSFTSKLEHGMMG